ncbi:MAG: bifunctional glutamate N-acetyltransferase/amino-acid acetyltransferase ArgJ [Acidimicrobiales bacterium]
MSAVSPLAPDAFPTLPAVRGVQLATLAAGLRYQGRADLFLATVPEGATVVGTLTRSLCPSAPVDWCRRLLPSGAGRAIAVNAGNANAFTGRHGATDVEATADAFADALGLTADDIYLSSTGVIGETLPMEAFTAAVPAVVAGLAPSDAAGWEAAANAIRTTDTFAKGAGVTIDVEGTEVHVVGIAKGSGMIAPDMATMLGYLFLDAAVDAALLQELTSHAVVHSFNRVTVDSDTSTSDTVLSFATGDGPRIEAGSEAAAALAAAIDTVALDLAHQIVRDGEGATKFVAVTVEGAADDEAAAHIARAIADSPLVKTALAASDANWGRIVMAVGKAGQRADRDALAIWVGDELVAEGGVQAETYSEDRATAHLQGDEVTIRVDVGVGDGVATVWTCDLTHGYIDINAGYRS